MRNQWVSFALTMILFEFLAIFLFAGLAGSARASVGERCALSRTIRESVSVLGLVREQFIFSPLLLLEWFYVEAEGGLVRRLKGGVRETALKVEDDLARCSACKKCLPLFRVNRDYELVWRSIGRARPRNYAPWHWRFAGLVLREWNLRRAHTIDWPFNNSRLCTQNNILRGFVPHIVIKNVEKVLVGGADISVLLHTAHGEPSSVSVDGSLSSVGQRNLTETSESVGFVPGIESSEKRTYQGHERGVINPIALWLFRAFFGTVGIIIAVVGTNRFGPTCFFFGISLLCIGFFFGAFAYTTARHLAPRIASPKISGFSLLLFRNCASAT